MGAICKSMLVFAPGYLDMKDIEAALDTKEVGVGVEPMTTRNKFPTPQATEA